jgi:hypothetical protein
MQPDSQSEPPVIGPPPPLAGGTPPLPTGPARKPGPLRQVLTLLLSACLALFLADAIISLADDSLIVLFGVHVLGLIRFVGWLLAVMAALVVYLLIGLTPMIPKRAFLPLTLFNLVGTPAMIPVGLYFYSRIQQISWGVSLCQVVLGLAVLRWAQGGLRFRWPLVPSDRLRARRFSWLNLSGFAVGNICVLLPVMVVYLALCVALAVGHLSQGFMALGPGGFRVQVRKYVRADGKSIQLVPMAHVGERDFYWKLSHSFPTNAVVLMEGVTDNRNLLTNTITYHRMASSLGLAEQQHEFKPVEVEIVPADVDIADFTTNTIGFLNLVMLIHGKGLKAENVLRMLQFSPPPHFEEQLWDDLLHKRNQHLLKEIQDRLSDPEPLIVPWGVAHMPGIAEGIKASGFHLAESHDYTVIRFGTPKPTKAPASTRLGD